MNSLTRLWQVPERDFKLLSVHHLSNRLALVFNTALLILRRMLVNKNTVSCQTSASQTSGFFLPDNAGTVRQLSLWELSREWLSCLWAAEYQMRLADKTEPNSTSESPLNDAIAWHYVMWFDSLEIIPYSNTSLLCCKKWSTEMSNQIVIGHPFVVSGAEFPTCRSASWF